eukprot:SAG22_NODE_847_length_6866_cov_6.246638_4_plen_1049_part_00
MPVLSDGTNSRPRRRATQKPEGYYDLGDGSDDGGDSSDSGGEQSDRSRSAGTGAGASCSRARGPATKGRKPAASAVSRPPPPPPPGDLSVFDADLSVFDVAEAPVARGRKASRAPLDAPAKPKKSFLVRKRGGAAAQHLPPPPPAAAATGLEEERAQKGDSAGPAKASSSKVRARKPKGPKGPKPPAAAAAAPTVLAPGPVVEQMRQIAEESKARMQEMRRNKNASAVSTSGAAPLEPSTHQQRNEPLHELSWHESRAAKESRSMRSMRIELEQQEEEEEQQQQAQQEQQQEEEQGDPGDLADGTSAYFVEAQSDFEGSADAGDHMAAAVNMQNEDENMGEAAEDADAQTDEDTTNATCDHCSLRYYTASGNPLCVDCRELPASELAAQNAARLGAAKHAGPTLDTTAASSAASSTSSICAEVAALDFSLPFGGELLSPASGAPSDRSSSLASSALSSPMRSVRDLPTGEGQQDALAGGGGAGAGGAAAVPAKENCRKRLSEEARDFELAAASSAMATWGASPYRPPKLETAAATATAFTADEDDSVSSFHSAVSHRTASLSIASRQDAESGVGQDADTVDIVEGMRAEPGVPTSRYYRCVRQAQLRAGADMDSKKCGVLKRGEIIAALDVQQFAAADADAIGAVVRRVQCSRGWVTLVSSGGVVALEECEEPAAAAAEGEEDVDEREDGKVVVEEPEPEPEPASETDTDTDTEVEMHAVPETDTEGVVQDKQVVSSAADAVAAANEEEEEEEEEQQQQEEQEEQQEVEQEADQIANMWEEAGFELDPETGLPILSSARNKMDAAFENLAGGAGRGRSGRSGGSRSAEQQAPSAEFTGFLGDGAVSEIEAIMPEIFPAKIEIDDEDSLLSFDWQEFVSHLSQGFYIGAAGSVQAVADGVMAFATFPKKPEVVRDKAYMASAGLTATNTPVPGTKAKKVWVLHKAAAAAAAAAALGSVDLAKAAELSNEFAKAAPLGPFQQHMRRYRLELAQCGGHVGCALLRTFVDVFLFNMYAEVSDALNPDGCGGLADPHTATVLAPTEPIEHGGG